MSRATGNLGVILIDARIWKEIGEPCLSDIHDALLLPDDYHVEHLESWEYGHKVIVKSAFIPDGPGIAELKPIYGANSTAAGHTPFFDHMEIGIGNQWRRLPRGEQGL